MSDYTWTVNILGWLGTFGLFAFYWLLGSGKVLQAYIWGCFGAAGWLTIGILSHFDIHAEMPSLVLMETVVIIMNIRGIFNWRKQKEE